VKSWLTETKLGFSVYLPRVSRSAVLVAAIAVLPLAGCKPTHNADVVATVNGKAIMHSEMDKLYQAQLGEAQQQQQQQQQPSQEQADAMRLQVLGSLINEEIVDQRAAKLNLTATNEEVEAKLNEMKAPYSEDQFEAKLKASNRTLDDLRHDIRRSLTSNKLLTKEIDSKITVTDADVSNYFNQHKNEFNLIETQYHLAQIQVTGVPSQANNLQNSKATNDVEAKKKIQALKNRLDSGEDFGALAANFSEDPDAASSGGDLGFVPESRLHQDHPAIYAEVAKLKPGQVTDILPLLDGQTKKPIGYAIYKLISREPAGQRDLSDPRVQQSIRQQLRDGRAQLLKAAYFEMLRDQAKVENFFAEQIFKNDAH
jgi:peptidyl-prolyl cis-trans isomerase SurA